MAKKGETRAEEHQDTRCHFVCYVEKDGFVWELDGRLDGPVCKGVLPEGAHLGVEVSKIVKGYIAMNGESGDVKFNVMALAPSFGDYE